MLATSVEAVKLNNGELSMVYCKLDTKVDEGTALLIDRGLLVANKGLRVVGGAVKVITKEAKQYVNIPVLNEGSTQQSKLF